MQPKPNKGPSAASVEEVHVPKARLSRREMLRLFAAAPPIVLVAGWGGKSLAKGEEGAAYDATKHHWGYAVDIAKCIGCGACMRACRAENNVPKGRHRTWVERYRIDSKGKAQVDAAPDGNHVFGDVGGDVALAFFVPKICNHCEKSVCTQVCPVGATYHTPDGVVLVDSEHCVGCGYCVQACPYGTRYIKPTNHTAGKCTLCYHRITKGMKPACVAMCPRGARIFGDLKDPQSSINTLLRQHSHRVLRPELGTHPKCYYFGMHAEVI